MMYVYLKPIVLVFCANEAKHKILSMSEPALSLPSISIEQNADISEHIRLLLSRSLKENVQHLNRIKLGDIEVVDNNLYIYYIVFINYETDIQRGHLISLDINNVNLSQNIKSIISLLV